MQEPVLDLLQGTEEEVVDALDVRTRELDRPLQLIGEKTEHEHHHQRQPKRRHGVEEETHDRGDRIQQGVLAHGLHDAEQDPEDKRDSDGAH